MRICFVCLGNICRSPTAWGIFRGLVAEAVADGCEVSALIEIDSAGTGAWHVGEGPDRRSAAAARARGVPIDDHRASRFVRRDFDRFDLVVAMDAANVADLHELAADPARRAKVRRLREFDPASAARGDLDVPDPYYGGADGFADVFDLCDAACRGLLAEIRAGRITAAPA